LAFIKLAQAGLAAEGQSSLAEVPDLPETASDTEEAKRNAVVSEKSERVNSSRSCPRSFAETL